MKVVINVCYGGFSLSEKAWDILNKRGYEELSNSDLAYDCQLRINSDIIDVVEKLGDEANGEHAKLSVIDIPDDATDWSIREYDGCESVIYVANGKMYERYM